MEKWWEIRRPLPPEEAVEELEEAEGGRQRKPGGKKGEREFGTGLKAKRRRRKQVVEQARRKRVEERAADLQRHLKKDVTSEGVVEGYRVWLERILVDPEDIIRMGDKDEVIVSPARASKPGGQRMQKKLTAADACHLPTGISVHCEEESHYRPNREGAQERLEKKVTELAGQWSNYEKEAGKGAALDLFDETLPHPDL